MYLTDGLISVVGVGVLLLHCIIHVHVYMHVYMWFSSYMSMYMYVHIAELAFLQFFNRYVILEPGLRMCTSRVMEKVRSEFVGRYLRVRAEGLTYY